MNLLSSNILSVPSIKGDNTLLQPGFKSGLSAVMSERPRINVITYDNDDTAEEIKEESDEEFDDVDEGKTFDGVEIVKNIFVGGEGCACDEQGRKKRGITHVLSLYTEFEESYHANSDMKSHGSWMTVRLEDAADENLLQVLESCNKFIDKAMKQKQGKIVIHSLEGYSRSTSVCVAYLMMERNYTLLNAYNTVKCSRDVNINRGFWRQLHALDTLIHGNPSISADDLPGAIIFEKEALDLIIADYGKAFRAAPKKRRKPQYQPESPKSPRTSGRIRYPTRKMSLDYD